MSQAALALSRHYVSLANPVDFDGWRLAARSLTIAGVDPADVDWDIADDSSPILPPAQTEASAGLRVPRAFMEQARAIICHNDPERFALLHRVLERLQKNPQLLSIASDSDVVRLREMEKAIRRDIHKMRAFVRFRSVGERFLAWFEPSHFIVERNAPFFARRFTGMHWTILTAYRSASWDGTMITFGPGADKRAVPAEDAAEELWLTYYRNIFNPARLKVKAMQAEMPKKYWRNLPEAVLIPDLVAGAESAAKEMIANMPTQPAPHHRGVQAKHWSTQVTPTQESSPGTIEALSVQATACHRCPLWRDATQTVFGDGQQNASVIFVGEQPGDQEDIAGKPFVGPAGKVFDDVLAEAEIDRTETYVTNAVKHFKFEPRGKRRIHQRPNTSEVSACRWWIDHEIALIRPSLAVALGATAALSLLGKAVPIIKMRGSIVKRDDGLPVFLTVHPSFILRIPDPAAQMAERERFLADMKTLNRLMREITE